MIGERKSKSVQFAMSGEKASRKSLKTRITAVLAGLSGLILLMSGCGESMEQTAGSGIEEAEERAESNAYALPRPQDDYYRFINQEEILKAALKYGDVYGGPMLKVSEQIDEEIIAMIRECALAKDVSGEETGGSKAFIKAVYLQYLGELKAEQGGAAKGFLERKLEEIHNLDNIQDLCGLMEKWAEEEGFPVIFDPYIDRNYFRAEENAVYLEQKTGVWGISLKSLYEGDEMRKFLHSYAFDSLCAAGEEPEAADQKADDLVYLILDVACSTDYEIAEAENPFLTFTFTTEDELELFLGEGEIPDGELFKMIGVKNNPYGGLYVQDQRQLKELGELFKQDKLDTWKTYLICEVFYRYRTFLAKDFAFLSLYGGDSFLQPEEKAALYVNELLPEEVGSLYVQTYYTEEMDRFLDRIYVDITGSYRELISGADWLTKETRQGLLKKLETLKFIKPACDVETCLVTQEKNGGVPDGSVSDGSACAEQKNLIGEGALETFINIKAAKYRQDLAKIGQPHNRNESIMPAQIMNAAYSTDNTFTVTVAIMHAPYYDSLADFYTNLGGIGMVMAHEIGHAFDSNCIVFDSEGNYDPNWITEADREVLREKAEQMAEYYSSFTIMDVYHVDGEKTSGENYADKGGMECLMNLADTQDERRKIFENYAKIWCMLKEDSAAIEQLTTDEHSPEIIRVNAVLSSTEEFYELYEVKPGDGMYVEPEARVNRWRSW